METFSIPDPSSDILINYWPLLRPIGLLFCTAGSVSLYCQELRECYEALREASLLDSERSDVWAQLCLVLLADSKDFLYYLQPPVHQNQFYSVVVIVFDCVFFAQFS